MKKDLYTQIHTTVQYIQTLTHIHLHIKHSNINIKRTVARSHCNARRDQDNISKLLTALSAIAAPSDGTLQNLCTFLVRVPALGAELGGERGE